MDFEYIRNHKTVQLQRLVGPTLSPQAILSIDAGYLMWWLCSENVCIIKNVCINVIFDTCIG